MTNNYECEMISKGKAIELHLPKSSYLPKHYTQKRGLVLCEIKNGECPYGNASDPIFYSEFSDGIGYVCRTRGLKEFRLKYDNS